MATYVFSPTWFYGIDTVFELISLIVCFLIAFYSFKTYRFSSEKKYLFFSLSFFLLASSFFFKIISNITIFSRVLTKEVGTLVTISQMVLTRVHWFHTITFMLYVFLTILAFTILTMVAFKVKDKKLIILLLYFALVATIFTSHVFVSFFITNTILLIGISYHYYDNYLKRKKSKSARYVATSFGIILLSQIIFTFYLIGMIYIFNIYVIGETIQLLGYLFLLYTFVTVIRK